MDFQAVIDYIDKHLHEDICLADLAILMGYSTWHMYKLFKLNTGEPFASYIRKRRLFSAAQEMKSDKSLLNIALDNGYKTAAGFYKAFIKQFNCSPSEYKVRGLVYGF